MKPEHHGESWWTCSRSVRAELSVPSVPPRLYGDVISYLSNSNLIENLVSDLTPSFFKKVWRETELEKKIADLDNLVAAFSARLEEVTDELRRLKVTQEVIVVKKVDIEEARREIINYFKDRADEALFPSDVALALNLDAAVVRDICDELVATGELS